MVTVIIPALNEEKTIRNTGKDGGISFCSSVGLVDSVANYVIKEPDFNLLIPILA